MFSRFPKLIDNLSKGLDKAFFSLYFCTANPNCNLKNSSNMKKSFLTIIIAVMAISAGHAQISDGIIAQPTHIIGKQINAEGEVTRTLEADFTYDEDGRPSSFEIPDYEMYTRYIIINGYLNKESTSHNNGHPMLDEDLTYTYEEGKIKTIEHSWSHGYDLTQFWEYSYRHDGRVDRKDYNTDYPFADFLHHFIYEYGNDGKTKTENYWTSLPSQGMKLRQKTVYQYDDEYNLLSRRIEDYSLEGELTDSSIDTYTYTPSGKLDTQVTQILTDGEWVNNHIMHYVYGDNEEVLEQQDGSWSAENGEWDINRKVVFELSEDGTTYTVSFYKKDSEEWVWDVFNNQTILFGSALKNQQRTMRFYQDEIYNGMGRINQFEITLIYTNEPVYMGANENSLANCSIYPNPGSDNLKVEATVEDAVIRFYNLQGQLITARPFDFSTEISAEDWPSGIYLWEIWHDNCKEANGKWIKK